MVCYYGTWAVYRPDAGKFNVEDIDPFLCTHIIYGFTGLNYDNQIKPLDPWNDLADNYGKGAMKRFTSLKRINPDLKALVAIGGWNEGSIKYSKMAADPSARATFVKSVVEFLGKYDFDGLDLDWEYPGSRGGSANDKKNFVELLRELKQAFKPYNYLLSAAVSAGKWFIDPAYDIPQVSRYLDFINLMAYDYHGGWETKTGMNAPLFHSPVHDSRDDALLNVNFSVNYWLQNGAARDKLILGVGSYGRSFTLDRASMNGINAPASQKGQAGPYTREPGSLGYNEICEAMKRQPNAWTVVRDPHYLAPYAYNDRQWVGYDDVQSLTLKTQFAKSQGLGGIMMWSIETDDFRGHCHGEKFPLLNNIKRVLNGAQTTIPTTTTTMRPTSMTSTPTPLAPSTSRRPLTTKPPTTTLHPTTTTGGGHEVEEDEAVTTRPRPTPSSTTKRSRSTTRRPLTPTTVRPTVPVQPPITSAPTTTKRPIVVPPPTTDDDNTSIVFRCTSDGMFADPQDCTMFHRCVSGVVPGTFRDYRFNCAPGTAFSESMQICDHKYNVLTCKSNYVRYIYY
ncbi:Acidic mammalian chitinase, partial [Fragariocoptes setiger]